MDRLEAAGNLYWFAESTGSLPPPESYHASLCVIVDARESDQFGWSEWDREGIES